jgi:ABC-type sugar transport system permease subunit
MNKNKYDAILSKYSTLIIVIIPALTIFTVFVVLPIVEAAYSSC